MSSVLETIALALLAILAIALYIAAMKTLLPRFVLRVRYSSSPYLGRGLKKYKSEGGRAVLYEPHPRIRKYIRTYALYAKGGYKYLRCKVDEKIRTLSYVVLMYNNKDKVIDSLEVYEKIGDAPMTKELSVHQDTSYVALVLKSVNEERVEAEAYSYYRVFDLVMYAILSVVFTYAMLLFTALSVNTLVHSISGSQTVLLDNLKIYAMSAILVGAFCTMICAVKGDKNGIAVRLNGKK